MWLYARSATSPAAVDAQHHHLAATAARHGLIVAGRSGDLGADPELPGWDAAAAAVADGEATDVIVHHQDRLGRAPGAFARRLTAIHAGGRLWAADPPDALRPINPNALPSPGGHGTSRPHRPR